MIYYNSKIINKTGGNRVYYNGKIISQNVVKIKPITKDTLAFEFSGNEPYVYKVNNQDYTATTSPVNVDIVQDLGIQEFTSAENMFNGNFSLQKITHIPDTSKVTNMNQMFFTCTNLTTVNLSNINTSQVTNMSAMFGGCSKLKSLNLSNFNTSKVTKMGSMFLSCFDLTELDVSKFDTSNVTNMGQMFGGCSKLKNLDLSNFNTSKVEFLGKLFEGCNNLTTINLSNWNLDNNVLAIYDMFKGCTSLTKITMNDCNCATQQIIKDAVKQSGIPDGQVTIESNVNCATNVIMKKMPNSAPQKYTVNGIEKTPEYINDTAEIRIDEEITNWEKGFYQGDKENPSQPWNPTALPSYITEIEIKDKLLTKNNTSMKYWLRGATNLTKLTGLENIDTSNVTNMWSTFEGTRIRSLDLSKWDLIHCNDIGAMFMNCYDLQELKFPRFNSDLCESYNNLFNGCGMLKFIDLSNFVGNFNTNHFIQMGWMFKDCHYLEIIDLSGWNLEKADRDAPMFEHCDSLHTIACYGCNEETVHLIRQMVNPNVQVLPSRYKYEEIVGKTTCQGYDKYAIEGEMVTEDYGQTWTATGKERVGRLIEKDSKDCGYIPPAETFNLEFEFTTNSFYYYINNQEFRTTANPTIVDIKNDLHIDKINSLQEMFNTRPSALWGNGLTKVTKLPVSPYCTNFSKMFYNCKNLTNVNFDNFKIAIGASHLDMFYGCTRLREISVIGCDEDTIKIIEDEINKANLHPTIIRN